MPDRRRMGCVETVRSMIRLSLSAMNPFFAEFGHYYCCGYSITSACSGGSTHMHHEHHRAVHASYRQSLSHPP